jgi:hypothetical protein
MRSNSLAEWLVDPIRWTVIAIIVVLSVVFGRLRREPAWAIAANTVGATGLLIGLRWATALSDEAFAAAALASGGLALWVEASQRARARQETQGVKAQH